MGSDRTGPWRGSNGGPVHNMGPRPSPDQGRVQTCARSGFNFPIREMVQVEDGKWVHPKYLDEVVHEGDLP